MNIIPIHVDKEIEPSDNIADIILKSGELCDGDIIVVAQKIISKQEGQLVDLSTVTPSLLAQGIGSQYNKDPRIIELILSESRRIVRMGNGIMIVETRGRFVCANAGIDESNTPEGYVTLLPVDSDASARNIQRDILKQSQKNVAVIVSDTFGRPFRLGQTNHAIGISGISPILDYAGTTDSFDKILRITAIAIVDELCAASELVMGKSLKCPIAIIRDCSSLQTDEGNADNNGSISELLRPEDEDLFI